MGTAARSRSDRGGFFEGEAAPHDAIDTRSAPDAGIRLTLAQARASSPEVLLEAESILQSALTRGTMSSRDRAALGALIGDLSVSDRERLAASLLGAAEGGRLVIED